MLLYAIFTVQKQFDFDGIAFTLRFFRGSTLVVMTLSMNYFDYRTRGIFCL